MSNKSIVYYIPFEDSYSRDRGIFSLECVLTHKIVHFFDVFANNDILGIKINSSEEQGVTYHDHGYISVVSKLLHERNIYPVACDTSWKFRNRNVLASTHMKNMFNLGFSYQDIKIPFVMLDGVGGNSEICIESKEKNYVYLAGEMDDLNGVIFFSSTVHHPLAGFEGALYNMGFGLASKRGKIIQHSTSSPKVNSEKCYYCRKCLHQCPVGAIFVKDRHVEIDSDRCIDCGKCVEIAQYGGIVYDWDATPSYFQKNIAKYANGISNKLKKKMFFCNFVPKQESENNLSFVGILISMDPLAVDLATRDLICNEEKKQKIDMTTLFQSALKYKVGSLDYDLITVNY